MGKLTISMAMFNSYVCLPEGSYGKWPFMFDLPINNVVIFKWFSIGMLNHQRVSIGIPNSDTYLCFGSALNPTVCELWNNIPSGNLT